MNPRVLMRKSHRWGAMLVALPFLAVIGSGLTLQLKKQWSWVQPAERRGASMTPSLPFDQIMLAARSVPEAGITSWDDVDKVDVRPGKGIMKVSSKTRWEIQLDAESGKVLHSAYRRSDLLESIHDGSWFHPVAKLAVFFPVGIVVFGLWLTGIYLWFLPILTRRRRDRKHARTATR